MSPASAPPSTRRLRLPADVDRVVAVFVNAVELPPDDYRIDADRILLRRAVRPAGKLRRRDLLRIALCVESAPDGDEIDAIVLRGGGLTTIRIGEGDRVIDGGGRWRRRDSSCHDASRGR